MATNPQDLARAHAADVALNASDADEHIACAAARGKDVIVAWGRWSAHRQFAARVASVLPLLAPNLLAWRLTKDGTPMRPLARGKIAIPYGTIPVSYSCDDAMTSG